MTAHQDPPDDPRPLLDRALAQVAALAAGVDDADLVLPTPCTDWAVRDLLGHLVTVHRRLLRIAGGGDAVDLPLVTAVPGDDHAAPLRVALARDGAAVHEAWRDDTVLTRTATVPWGTHPGTVLGLGYVRELAVHAWDLARALGRVDELDPGVAEPVVELTRRTIPAQPRGGPIPFGPPVDVPPDADPYVRLAGWLGRPV